MPICHIRFSSATRQEEIVVGRAKTSSNFIIASLSNVTQTLFNGSVGPIYKERS